MGDEIIRAEVQSVSNITNSEPDDMCIGNGCTNIVNKKQLDILHPKSNV